LEQWHVAYVGIDPAEGALEAAVGNAGSSAEKIAWRIQAVPGEINPNAPAASQQIRATPGINF